MDNRLYEEQVNDLIDNVIGGVKESWPTLYKIRYVYLEIGKRLKRDTDFFLSVDKKLGEKNLSVSEIASIYDSDIGRNLAIICKSGSAILKRAYERIGIRAQLVETNTSLAYIQGDKDFAINHWFLVVYDGDDAYFMTLTPDLPYIQMNMETRHFGSDIPYKRDYNGKVMQIYKGEEIKHSTISRDVLKKIDMEIGYIDRKYLYNDKHQKSKDWVRGYDNNSLFMLKDELLNNKLFYELNLYKSSFYKTLTEFKGEDNRSISFAYCDINDLSDEDFNCFARRVCGQVLNRLENIVGYNINVIPSINSSHWNYRSWLFNLCILMEFEIMRQMVPKDDADTKIKADVMEFDYSKWSREIKSKYSFNREYDSILLIIDKMNALVNSATNRDKRKNMRKLLGSLGEHFIDEEIILENNIDDTGYLSNYYIARKFNDLFRYIFDCNNTISDFNKMGYSEQLVIVKDIVNLMFPEVNKNNSMGLDGYDMNYNAVMNRIHIYTVRGKYDDEYSMVFDILGNYDEREYSFVYNPGRNLFRAFNLLDFYNDYIIVSNRLKNKISVMDLEKIGKRKR